MKSKNELEINSKIQFFSLNSLSIYHTHTHNTHQLVKRIFELLKKTPDVIFLQSKEPSNSELRMRIMENVLHNVLRYIIHKTYTVQLFILESEVNFQYL